MWGSRGNAGFLTRRLAATLIAVSATTAAAFAQTDVCKKLDEELIKQGKAASAYAAALVQSKESEKDPEGTAKQVELDALAKAQSPVLVTMDSTLAAPGEGLASFEDKRIPDPTDPSKICVKVFRQINVQDAKWDDVGVRQVFVSEKTTDKPKRLNVIFTIDDAESDEVAYLFVGALGDAAPLAFSYTKKVRLTSKLCAILEALAFVGIFYAFLAWITYNEETANVKGPAWIAYTFSPVRISSSWFGEASMSQVQLLIFTFIVAGLLFYHWLIAGILSDLSMNLLMLIGISAVGTGASKFAQTVKTSLNDQTARYLIGKGWYAWPAIPARSHATLSRLLLTDGRLDIYKFQMAIFTIVVACYVISVGKSSLVDVKISETMLYLIGISQGVYVGGKAITDRTTDLEAAVTKMMELESPVRDAEVKIAAGGARPAGLDDNYDQYRKAARTAAVEFTSLQNRMFPTKFEAATQRMTAIAPQVAPIKKKIESGTALTADEQALQKDFELAEMTAKEYAAYSEPVKKIEVQKIENIDPAILRP